MLQFKTIEKFGRILFRKDDPSENHSIVYNRDPDNRDINDFTVILLVVLLLALYVSGYRNSWVNYLLSVVIGVDFILLAGACLWIYFDTQKPDNEKSHFHIWEGAVTCILAITALSLFLFIDKKWDSSSCVFCSIGLNILAQTSLIGCWKRFNGRVARESANVWWRVSFWSVTIWFSYALTIWIIPYLFLFDFLHFEETILDHADASVSLGFAFTLWFSIFENYLWAHKCFGKMFREMFREIEPKERVE